MKVTQLNESGTAYASIVTDQPKMARANCTSAMTAKMIAAVSEKLRGVILTYLSRCSAGSIGIHPLNGFALNRSIHQLLRRLYFTALVLGFAA